jgi:hypothetical protein
VSPPLAPSLAPSTPHAPAPAPPQAPFRLPAPAASPLPSYLHLPPILPYEKGLPVTPGYRVVERSASGLLVGGALTFGAAYAAALAFGASQGFDNGTSYGAIPIVGPWAAIGGRSFRCSTSIPVSQNTTGKAVQDALNKCVGAAFDEIFAVVFLTADGLIQATGAVLFFVGLASGREELVREDLPQTAIDVFPEGGGGLRVGGTF